MEIRPLVGIPTERMGTVDDQCFWHFLRIARQGWDLVQEDYGRIDIARNRMAQALLNSERHTHLIMLDADHKHPPDVVAKLLRWPLKDRDRYQVVAGLNYRRSEPYEPIAWFKKPEGGYVTVADWPVGVVKVDLVGTAAICIDRRVFQAIPPPWWKYDYPPEVTAKRTFVYPSEDVWFCGLCGEHNIDIWVDTTLTSPHAVRMYADRAMMERYLKQHPERVEKVEVADGSESSEADSDRHRDDAGHGGSGDENLAGRGPGNRQPGAAVPDPGRRLPA